MRPTQPAVATIEKKKAKRTLDFHLQNSRIAVSNDSFFGRTGGSGQTLP
jgi:hypothetical protein